MTTIQPKGESMKQAIKWISEMHEEGKEPYHRLLEQAAGRFNLSPKEEEFLRAFYRKESGAS